MPLEEYELGSVFFYRQVHSGFFTSSQHRQSGLVHGICRYGITVRMRRLHRGIDTLQQWMIGHVDLMRINAPLALRQFDARRGVIVM